MHYPVGTALRFDTLSLKKCAHGVNSLPRFIGWFDEHVKDAPAAATLSEEGGGQAREAGGG